jgi:hypothetical protein
LLGGGSSAGDVHPRRHPHFSDLIDVNQDMPGLGTSVTDWGMAPFRLRGWLAASMPVGLPNQEL